MNFVVSNPIPNGQTNAYFHQYRGVKIEFEFVQNRKQFQFVDISFIWSHDIQPNNRSKGHDPSTRKK